MDDLISRQAAINGADEIIRRDRSGNNDVVKAMTAWKEWVKALPSAEPKKGKWIPSEEGSTEAGSCSNCGWTAYLYENDVVGMPYCPNCGADMRESK